MQAVVALAILGAIIYGYIKVWMWLGGKIGEAIGRALDGRGDNLTQTNNVASAVSTNQSGLGIYFDRVLYEIQCHKRRGKKQS